MVSEIESLTSDGVRFSLKRPRCRPVLREAVEVLMPAGTCVLLGSARAGTEVALEMPFLQNGRTIDGVMQGESHPQELIPRLVDYLMRGEIPSDYNVLPTGELIVPLAFYRRHDNQAGLANAGIDRLWQFERFIQ